jgi:hypothetical protein
MTHMRHVASLSAEQSIFTSEAGGDGEALPGNGKFSLNLWRGRSDN